MSGWNTRSDPPAAVEAVLFDLGNTLVSYYRSSEFAPILRRCVTAVAQAVDARSGRERPAAELELALARAAACDRERDDHRVRPLADRLREVFALAEAEADWLDELGSIFLEPIFATAKPVAGALETLNTLKSLGIKTAIVSNTPWGSPAAAWRAELKRHGLLAAVDTAVFCVDVGRRKPAREPFEAALARLRADARRSWFVGDDPVWDVEGARAAGLTPVLVGSRVAPPNGLAIERVTDLPTLVRSAS